MKREKYANKSPLMRIFHKYTGIILVVSIGLIMIVSYFWSESIEFYFEDYSCTQIVQMISVEKTPAESIRYEEILNDCIGEKFNP